VRLALAAAEYVLGRPARSVLDVGCGEAPWRAILKRLRRGIAYQGVDSSEYVVRRYGRRRGIARGALADLAFMGLAGPWDLVVCSDVLHYVRGSEARAGLEAIAARTGGVAFLEAFASDDAIEGDHAEFQPRRAVAYRALIASAGLVPLGLHLYTTRERFAELTALEQGAAAVR
jgi:SAM-dependent methyltransferase